MSEFIKKKKTTLEEQTVFCYWCGEEFELKPLLQKNILKDFRGITHTVRNLKNVLSGIE